MRNFKHLIFAILISSPGFECYPQNLIANGSFEDSNTCTEADAECAPEAWKTTSPLLLIYAGEKANKYVEFTVFNNSVPNTRQYLQIKLLCPLIKDKLYKFSLKLKSSDLQIGSVGALVSDSILFYDRDILIERKPSIDLSNSMNRIPKQKIREWNAFSIDYHASGFEKYLIIGNFQNDSEQKRTFKTKYRDFTNYTYSINDIELIPIDRIEICPDFEKTRETLYSLNDRHPLKRYNLFGDDEPQIIETVRKVEIDTIRIGSAFFEFDSYKIDSIGKITLDSLFNQISKGNIDFIKIYGHADSIGDKDYNRDLSFHRAVAIKELLSTHDLVSYITDIKGFGDTDPIASNSTEEGRKRNRQVEVIIKYKVCQ